MPEGKLFNCPSCGASLKIEGDAAQIQCAYCGNMVVVPEELRSRRAAVRIAGSTPQPASGASKVPIVTSSLILLAFAGALVALWLRGAPAVATPIPKVVSSPTPAGFAHSVLSFGGQGTAPGLFQDARHIAVDSDGNTYVDDQNTLRIQKFDPTGKYVSSWMVDQSLCPNTSAGLNTLAADRAGKVYVHYCGEILKYEGATGKLLDKFNGDKNNPRDFYLDMVLYPDGGFLVMSDATSSTISEVLLRLDANGKVLARYPNPVTSQSKRRAQALTIEPAMDGLGNIFLLNHDDYAVYKFTPDGKFVNKFGSVGTGIGQFDVWAQHIAIDNQSRVYITDFSGIKVFDSNGAFLESMSDRPFGAILEMRISEKNEIYLVGGSSKIYKLALNKP
jgi:hypothetical protein